MASYVDDVFTDDVFEDAIYTGVFTDKIFEVNIKDKLIFLNDGVRTFNPISDLYVELRYHRANNESIRRLDMPIKASGNLPKGGGIFTGRLSTFYDGWKVVPADDADHTLTITGEQIDGLGLSGIGLINKDNLVHNVDVVYAPPPASEIIRVEVNVLTPEQNDKLFANATAEELELAKLEIEQLLTDLRESEINDIHNIIAGDMEIADNQVVYEDANNSENSIGFELIGKDGNPTMGAVYKRSRL